MIKFSYVTCAILLTAGCSTAKQVEVKESIFVFNNKFDRYDNIREKIKEHADKNSVPFNLAYSIVKAESKFNPKARGKGTYGLGQIKCSTARSLGFKDNCNKLYEIDVNLNYSMKYLRKALDITKNNQCYAATLYNRGLGNKPTSSNYCKKILANI